MKKTEQHTPNYSISKTGYQLLDKIKNERLIVFTPKDIIRLLSWEKQKVHNLLQQLKKKNIILSLKRNAYVITETIEENIFQIAVESISPSYISFWSALSYYGFTEQQPMVIEVVTTKQYDALVVGKYKIAPTRFKKERFFGYKKLNNFAIAEKEKCIIDSLAYPEKAGGLQEVVKCLKNAWNELDKKTFLNCLSQFDSPTLNARAGYLLETLRLSSIKVPLPSTYVKLSSKKPSNKIRNKKWRLIINEEVG